LDHSFSRHHNATGGFRQVMSACTPSHCWPRPTTLPLRATITLGQVGTVCRRRPLFLLMLSPLLSLSNLINRSASKVTLLNKHKMKRLTPGYPGGGTRFARKGLLKIWYSAYNVGLQWQSLMGPLKRLSVQRRTSSKIHLTIQNVDLFP
jgi:hypothetical protein